jgi:hypothetical protein
MEIKCEQVVKYNVELTDDEYFAMCSLMEAIDRNVEVKLILKDYVGDKTRIFDLANKWCDMVADRPLR